MDTFLIFVQKSTVKFLIPKLLSAISPMYARRLSLVVGAGQTRIVAVPEAREAYGRFPCDRHRDRSELELMFGDSVDFGLCDAKVRARPACEP